MWAPIPGQIYIQALQFSELPSYVFGERHALPRLRCIDGRNSAGAAAARNFN
jgi:hypothetical protein